MLKLSNWNDIISQCRTNKYSANNHKQKEMRDISWFIKKIPPIKKYPIEITFKWHIKNSRADLDNKSCKSILDCMQNLGILENDNAKHINAIHHYAILDTEEYIEMEINEI
jgi:Holliday junction resolvase RusA-like endonuclease